MAYSGPEQRIDLEMREFVGKIIAYLEGGGDHANARMNMTERGVPAEVQHRVLNGQAARR